VNRAIERVRRHLAIWNPPSAEQRRAMVRELWTEDALHVFQPPHEVLAATAELNVTAILPALGHANPRTASLAPARSSPRLVSSRPVLLDYTFIESGLRSCSYAWKEPRPRSPRLSLGTLRRAAVRLRSRSSGSSPSVQTGPSATGSKTQRSSRTRTSGGSSR
jgi:hypothetical protein